MCKARISSGIGNGCSAAYNDCLKEMRAPRVIAVANVTYIFTPGNYFYNGVGHVTVQYEKVLEIGYEGIIAEAEAELEKWPPS